MSPQSSVRPAVLALALAVLGTSMASCGSPRRGEPIIGPVTIADASIERGRMAYEKHCYKCHTQGEGGMAPAINDKPLPRFLMRFQVRHGLGTMPSFTPERISDAEVEDILNYLMDLRKRGPR
jgi:mono/diheme cytochrome c family protein